MVDASASLVPYDETSKAAQPHDRALADAATPTPLAQPILRGSALHGMPVSKTTTIPVSATQQQRFDNLPERFDDEFASYRRPHRSSAYAMHKGALRRLEPEGCSSPGMEINVCGA